MQNREPPPSDAIVRSQKRSIACHRCRSQKIKCSGENPCLRCQRSGHAAQCRYTNRDRKIKVDESYLEQLIQDSQQLHAQRRASQRAESTHEREVLKSPPRSTQTVQDYTVGEAPWFQHHEAFALPIYTSEASSSAFAARLCQFLRGPEAQPLHPPRWHHIEESTLESLLQVGIEWPSLASAQLLVKTALGHINPSFHLALKKEMLDALQTIYQKEDFENPSLKCRYFAMFAIGQVYSTTPSNPSTPSTVPGLVYFAKSLNLIKIIPERPSLIHIESLISLAYFCQFLNRFNSAYCLLGSALRLSVSAGLNYNVPLNQNLHPVEREHRLRIWWSIYVLDRYWGSKLGFPVQIHDDDIDVDLPSSLASETYSDQFTDSAYQVAAIELAKITGNTTTEIYSRKKSTESFLQREQKLLIQLKQWIERLPEHLRLHDEKQNSKHTVLIHLQFSYCLILALRPVVLKFLVWRTQTPAPASDSSDDLTPILTTLSEACIHAARYSLKLCLDEWTCGSLAVYGYAFPAFLFSSAVVLMISSLLPIGIQSDMVSVDTAAEMLKILSSTENLAARDFSGHLSQVRQCFDEYKTQLNASSTAVIPDNVVSGYLGSDPVIWPYLSASVQEPIQSSNSYTGNEFTHLSPATTAPVSTATADYVFQPDLTTEMALHSSLMEEFLNQSTVDDGSLGFSGMLNDFDAMDAMSFLNS